MGNTPSNRRVVEEPKINPYAIQMKIKEIERECKNILLRINRNVNEMNRYYRENSYDNMKLIAKSVVQDRQQYIRFQKLLAGYNILLLGLTGAAAQQYQQRAADSAMNVINQIPNPGQRGGTLDIYLHKYIKYESKFFNDFF
jgi:hypothetical protein